MNNKKKYIIVLTLFLLVTVVSFSFAYFFASNELESKLTLDIETVDNKTLIFNKGDAIGLYVTIAEFFEGGEDIISQTEPSVTLTSIEPSTEVYSVFLTIQSNTIAYTTESETAELLLNVYDENNEEIKVIENLTYVDDDNISAFDITGVEGLIPISIDREITFEDVSVTHDWTFKVTLRNLDEMQNLNLGAELKAQVCLAQSVEECDFTSGFGTVIIDANGGKEYIEGREEPNFAVVAEADEGMYAIQEDYGTSYYFRGAVENNWVKFGGFYWRIIRIDETGNVKLIYSGPEETGPIATGEDTHIGTSLFTNTSVYLSDGNLLYKSTEGLGYVYTDGEIHGNTVDSEVKIVLDTWYNDNLKYYDSYIANANFCIDRTSYLDNACTTELTSPISSTHYTEAYLRLDKNKTPSLGCVDPLDKLNFKIGLISADEVSIAGGLNGRGNAYFYLHSGYEYSTLTPYSQNQIYGEVFSLAASGNLSDVRNSSLSALRPVISLKSNVTVLEGVGTIDDPYVIN